MSTKATSTMIRAKKKVVILGRSAATGLVVLAPVQTKKSTISDQQIAAAVKSVLDRNRCGTKS